MCCAQTIPYMPPELLEDARLGPSVDVYSFGVIMWECFTGQVRACASESLYTSPQCCSLLLLMLLG